MSRMLKSTGAMGAATLLSRVLGLVREIVYARFMGDGAVASAFQFAFQIPNLFRRLLGEGVLTAAFIPLFKEQERTEGEARMWRAANAVLSGLCAVSAGIVLVAVVLISLALLGLRLDGETRLMLELLRVMFPYLLLVCVAAVLMGMLNARGHFFVPALGPVLLNLVMIGSVLWLAPRMGASLEQQIFALALGVLAAGVVQAAFQLPLLRREGFRARWETPWRDPTVRKVAQRMLPGIVGVAAFQINVLLTSGLAFWYGTGGQPIVASFNYAVRLMELPQGVFGISLATYLLPTLSELAAERRIDQFRTTLREAVGYLGFVNLLCSALLIALAEPIVRLLFERGEFDAAATARASFALWFLAPGLVSFSLVHILARAFYALGDVRTPMRISVGCLALNLALAFSFIWSLEQGGLALANTLSSLCNASLLAFALRVKLERLELAGLRRDLLACLAAAAIAGIAAWSAAQLWSARVGHAALWERVGEVFAPLALGALVYLAFTAALGVRAARHLLASAFGRRNP
jgi:putative peptidoglycan lipid II flippase